MSDKIPDVHGWAGTGSVQTRFGAFEFEGGYPTAESARKLAELLTLNRAVEVFLSLMHGVSWHAVWRGVATAGKGAPNQLVVWESLMDARTLLLTGNTDTVYGMAAIDLKRDGPMVVEIPPMLLGGLSDIWQAEIAGIGPTGVDKGKGGKLLLLPPGYEGPVPDGYLIGHATTYRVVFGVRGFQVEGKTDHAVSLMKSTRLYPLAHADSPPETTFFNGSGQEIDTIFADTVAFFEDLAQIVAYEPDRLTTEDWFRLAAIGIERRQALRARCRAQGLAGRRGHARWCDCAFKQLRVHGRCADRRSRPALGMGVYRRQRYVGCAGVCQHRPSRGLRLHCDWHVARDGRKDRWRRVAILHGLHRQRRVGT